MAIKLLINGEAGAGKTDLLRTLGEETLVISRDAKEFSLAIPHMLVDTYYDMSTLIYGAGEGDTRIEGIVDIMNKYHEHFGKFPENVAIDSVSQLFMDVIDKASQTPNVYGSQGAEVTREMAMLTKFIHEELELAGINVILLNHVIEEKDEGKPTGSYVQFGSGKFLAKGGFYSTTNEAVTIVAEPSGQRSVYTRGKDKQARTSLTDIPDKLWVENTAHPDKSKRLKEEEYYFTLKGHLDMLKASQQNVKTFRFN